MDADFWAARIHPANAHHRSALHAAHLDNNSSNNTAGHGSIMIDEGDDDVRAWFPCPFCYVEIEVPVLCSHLQEEHCFAVRNAVCPLCAANLGKDAIGHFILQHAHSVKRRRKFPKSSFSSSITAATGRDLHEISTFLSTTSFGMQRNELEPAPDPLLSPFLCTAPFADPIFTEQNVSADAAADSTFLESSEPSKPDPVQEKEYEEKRERATFIQELIYSTIF